MTDTKGNEKSAANAMWGGRFSAGPAEIMEKINASIDFDKRLYAQDIQGSKAHAEMLAKQGIISSEDAAQILKGLDQIKGEIEAGTFSFSRALEDIHMNVEARLREIIGDPAGRLHTARSRNDQVITDVRLWLRDELDAIDGQLRGTLGILVDLAEREADTLMPGFTHLQTAQPITLGHHLLAWFEMLARDRERFADCRRRVNVMPLGAAALAGTSFPIDRTYTAELLGFARPAENSLDAVSDRDFAIEFVSAAALLMTHLSRLSEELVLWSSAQFGFVSLADAWCTGSSIMPQKKNPDVPELLRGKTGRVNGHLVALLTLMKAQPLAYNKDNQEDKEPLFDTVDTVRDSLTALAGMLPGITVNATRMRDAARAGFATATDLADYLVRRGLPFRDAHEVVGRAVREGVASGRDLSEFPLDELRAFSPLIEADVFAVLTLEGSVAARDHLGGTAPRQVRAAATRARTRLDTAADVHRS